MAAKKLLLSKDKKIGGVCGGIADFFDIDPTLIRVVYVFLSFFSAAFPGVLLYVLLWAIIPNQPSQS